MDERGTPLSIRRQTIDRAKEILRGRPLRVAASRIDKGWRRESIRCANFASDPVDCESHSQINLETVAILPQFGRNY